MKVSIVNQKQFGHSFFVSMFACIAVASPAVSRAQDAAEPKTARQSSSPQAQQQKQAESDRQSAANWNDLKGRWSECQFGGDGPIEISDKLITLGYGDPITGVKWEGEIPRDNYEIEVEARRVEGFDFFCAITFPIAKSHASLVLGGWGGGVVGISSIDDRDASDNDTTMFMNFDNGKWYRARIRIETTRLVVWLDDKLQFEHPRKDHSFDIRYEMDPCVPFGLANYQCKSEVRVVRVRRLAKKELGADLTATSGQKDTRK
jgi:hypothetical protein